MLLYESVTFMVYWTSVSSQQCCILWDFSAGLGCRYDTAVNPPEVKYHEISTFNMCCSQRHDPIGY